MNRRFCDIYMGTCVLKGWAKSLDFRWLYDMSSLSFNHCDKLFKDIDKVTEERGSITKDYLETLMYD